MKKLKYILIIIGFIVSIIVGYYLSALFVGKNGEIYNLFIIEDRYYYVLSHLTENYFTIYSALFILITISIYFVTILMLLFPKSTRNGEEQGSSCWESPERITKLLSDTNNSRDDLENIVVYSKREIFLISKLHKFLSDIWFNFKYRKER